MLVLSRRTGEGIRIAESIEIVVLEVRRGRVRLGFQAPKDVPIRRDDVREGSHQDEGIQYTGRQIGEPTWSES